MTARLTRDNVSWQRDGVTNDCFIGAINFIINKFATMNLT